MYSQNLGVFAMSNQNLTNSEVRLPSCACNMAPDRLLAVRLRDRL